MHVSWGPFYQEAHCHRSIQWSCVLSLEKVSFIRFIHCFGHLEYEEVVWKCGFVSVWKRSEISRNAMASSSSLCGRRQELRRCRSAAPRKRAESRVSSRSPPPSSAHPSEVAASPHPFYPAVADKHNSRLERPNMFSTLPQMSLKGAFVYLKIWSLRVCQPCGYLLLDLKAGILLVLRHGWLSLFCHPCLSTTS